MRDEGCSHLTFSFLSFFPLTLILSSEHVFPLKVNQPECDRCWSVMVSDFHRFWPRQTVLITSWCILVVKGSGYVVLGRYSALTSQTLGLDWFLMLKTGGRVRCYWCCQDQTCSSR